MKLHLNNKHTDTYTHQQGVTLIEVIVYSVLLSMLILSFISYAMTLHLDNIFLSNEIHDAYEQR
jgi:Tfp pilus assembly protein PilV